MEDQRPYQETPKSVGHSCEICDKTFARPEHLRRHVTTSHSKDRRFACETCAKEFVRRDALQRHALTHRNTEPNLIRKGGRACSNCSAAKARCTGEDPQCSRCRQREAECLYPSTNKKAVAVAEKSVGGLQSPSSERLRASGRRLDDNNMENQSEEQSQMALPLQQQSAVYEMQQFDPQYWNTAVQSINWLPLDFQDYVDVSPAFDNSLDPFAWASTYNVAYDPSFHLQGPSTGQTADHPILTPQDPSPASHGPGPSPSDSNRTRESELGQYYVDGEPARLPRVKRRRISTRHVAISTSATGRKDFSIAVNWTRQSAEADVPRTYISDDTYQAIAQTLLSLSQGAEYNQPTTPSSLFSEHFGADLPMKQDLEYLLALFAKHVLPILPILHATRLHSLGWQLTIAAAALGSHFLDQGAGQFTASMHELVRRILYVAGEDPHWLPGTNTEVLQLKLLHCIGLLYGGDVRLQANGARLLTDLALEIRTSSQVHAVPVTTDWQSFIERETFNRTWYAIWLLETQQAYQRQQHPSILLSSDMPPLPCPPRSWTALTAHEWAQQPTAQQPSLATVLETIYTTKELPAVEHFCEFTRTLLVHGIFHRTWAVATYFSQPLSLWEPTANKSALSPLKSAQQIWLPAHDTFAKWRNSACDCLDVLHWAANASIGENKGMEPATVLHLHVARVVLLTPYENIVSLARQLAGEKPQSAPEEIARDKQAIRRWVAHDQYKARLAMIHAGVMFWHVRRFSPGAWYEPDAVALSTLALWAFSVFSEAVVRGSRAASKPRQQPTTQIPHSDARQQAAAAAGGAGAGAGAGGAAGRDDNDNDTAANSRESSEEPVCPIILLDRPTDDELVQQFVRSGDRMKAHINGVGDLYGQKAPEKVLAEGIKLLKGLEGAWGCRDRWVRTLDRLAKVSRGRNGENPKTVHGNGTGVASAETA